ncbi:3-oxoacyl-[acyl-carrier-protein] synthase III C-terminal domain-containing protein [Pseudomonas sp. BTN1]|uniref:3-oxoacyl-[acyl-carrier-protein] synthase III C-terminal domain-containing protein n=1 Tax=Pseudomonas sp. BTN1 TaxID=1750647 RepID=UPI00093C2763|nr:3-oxoacyl-[acyl-carrier-protein] synthase III C-terminal domain-containing protein [Pseudomonas sp. BTN1]OKO50091.1 3-oxoacyl-ACP synthase [Pseudomonas sp. BTN1]
MKIIGISGTLPSRHVSNQDVLDLVTENSQKNFDGDLPHTLMIIDRLLKKNGTESRQWLAENESPMTLMETSFVEALKQANIDKKEIDLLLYSSISRGFIEPANSTFIAKALGLQCRSHDVVDACMGWVTSMDIINDKMKAQTIRYAAIINMEFGVTAPRSFAIHNFALQSASELTYKFPTYTLGEAVTVTILSNDSPENFTFSFINRPDLSDLCTIPLPDWQSFCNDSDIARIASAKGKFQLTSFGEHMHETGFKESTKILNEAHIQNSKIDCIFTHTSSPRVNELILQPLGMADKAHKIAHKTGNITTASAPFGIADAVSQGVLTRGKSCLSCIGSAGMVFSAMTFNF